MRRYWPQGVEVTLTGGKGRKRRGRKKGKEGRTAGHAHQGWSP